MLTKNSVKDIVLLEHGVAKLLYEAFPTNSSLYILGSGASARHSKMESALVDTIVEEYYKGGIYDVFDQTDNSLATNLLWRYMAIHEDVFLKELSRKIPDGFIKTRINEEYAQLTPLDDNPEYQVFMLAKKGSTIIDMNYEGFSAQNFKNYHHIIPMHGIANPDLAKFTKEIRHDILTWNLDMSEHSNIKRYPGEKQSNKIIAPYKSFLSKKVFPKLLWLVIIGYSFANTSSGLNDDVLYELIKEYVEYYKKIQIIIVNPNPEPIASLFEKELNRMIILPANWDTLTRAIQVSKLILNKNHLSDIMKNYYRFLEE